jgi:hypothetical protein
VATAMTIVAGPGKRATFTITVDDGPQVAATGSISSELAPGDYSVSMGKSTMTIYTAGGMPMPKSARFDIPGNKTNAAAIAVLTHTTQSIPMTVAGIVMGPVDDSDGGTGPGTGGSGNPSKDEFDALPDYIRNFLLSGKDDNAATLDYQSLVWLAKKIENLTPDEPEAYRARTTGGTGDVASLGASLDRYVALVLKERGAQQEQEEATQALVGLDDCYRLLQQWNSGWYGDVPNWIYDWEQLPVEKLPAHRDGYMNEIYLQLRRSLAVHGYANMAAFRTAIDRFVVAFRENTYVLAVDLLDRFEHVLRSEDKRYGETAGMAALDTDLAPARQAYVDGLARAKARSLTRPGRGMGGIDDNAVERLDEFQETSKAIKTVDLIADQHPLLGAQDFPRGSLVQNPPSGGHQVISSYVKEHLDKVHDTRERLSSDHEIIFKLDLLLAQAKARQGIQPNSIWDLILADHVAPTVDDVFRDMAIALFTIALGILSGGSLLAAAGSAALSAYAVVQQYEDYASKSDAYAAQLLSDDPSLAWVVLAVVGAVADFAAVSKFIKPVVPALKEFQAGKLTLEELAERMSGVEEKVRKAILARAEIEQLARQGWKAMLPAGGLRASVFGLEHIAGPIIYGVYINIRRGINTFNKWMLTREALELVGDATLLGPEQLAKVKTLFNQAVAETQRVANAGRKFGMAEAEVDAAIQAWAKSGSGTADDVIAQMARREVVVDRTATAGRVTRSSIPRGHVGGVMIQGPGGTYIKLLPLDAEGRAQGVVARIDSTMLAQATGAEASGKIVARASWQDRGHLLARILGGPDLTQNLAPLLKNINERDMRMVELEIREAIKAGNEATITVTPIYKAGRLDPDSFLMSVRWKDGSEHLLRKFANP